jgi:peptidoglycan-associated lipoprotein
MLTNSTKQSNTMRVIHFTAGAFLMLIFTLSAFGQGGSMEDANKAYKKSEYYNAVTLYQKAFSKEKNKSTKAEILFKIGECYKKINNTAQSEVWFGKAVKANYADPLALLYYADALKSNGKYDDAIVQYTKYSQDNSSDPRGVEGVKSSKLAKEWKEKPGKYKVDNLVMINTKYLDFSEAFGKKDYKTLIFTSNREEAGGKSIDAWTGLKFTDLFETTVDKKGKWSTPKPLPAPVNSDVNEGAASIDRKGDDMFFTRCTADKGQSTQCKIFHTHKNGSAWTEPELIPLAPDSFTVGHPSLNADQTVMYFSSDMAGGQGGKDIWMSSYEKSGKAWGKPVNLGPKINSSGDEMYPFIHADGSLYFSSNGYLGMGGLDIFKSKAEGKGWSVPENMKYPINSSGDDFGIIFEDEADQGYFTSNREGGKGSDDIYQFKKPPLIFILIAKVTNKETGALLVGAKVEVVGSNGTSQSFTTDGDGIIKAPVEQNTTYTLMASLDGYLTANGTISTVGLTESKDILTDLPLQPTDKTIVLPNILYDLGSATLRPESKDTLNQLIAILKDNPKIVIEIGSHTDSRATDEFNQKLSQDRAQSVVDFLIEKGVDKNRITAKGYGESTPRTLGEDASLTVNGKPFTFKKGDIITDDFITKLAPDYVPEKNEKGLSKTPIPDIQEAAHQLNRRTEFKVLRSNYVPGEKNNQEPDQKDNKKKSKKEKKAKAEKNN